MWFRSFLARFIPASSSRSKRAANPLNTARQLLLEGLERRSLLAVDVLALDVPGSTFTDINGINDSGQVVGSYTAGGTTHGFVKSGENYTTLDVPGATSTAAWDINEAGQIAGSYVSGGVTHGFLLSGGVYTTIDVPGSTRTMPRGIGEAGEVVGEFTAGGITHAFLLSGGTFTTLDPPGSTFAYASEINAAGQIVGRFDTGGTNFGYLLSEGVYTTIDVPASTSSAALGINDSGQIVGGFTAGGIRFGYLLAGGVFTTIEVSGATFTTPRKINDSGLIAGGYGALGMTHGFIATAEPPARVESLVVNDGSDQRSMVSSLTVTFDHLVTMDSGAFELRSQDGSLVGLNVASSVNGSQTVVVLTFTGSDIIGGSLADGGYTLTIRSTLVHDGIGRELDGDSDGSAGGDHVDAFFRLFGDSDGDRDVDQADLDMMLSSLPTSRGDGGYLWFFDYDGDDVVNGLDMAQFNHRRRS
jgi:uncharacterized membrane protein